MEHDLWGLRLTLTFCMVINSPTKLSSAGAQLLIMFGTLQAGGCLEQFLQYCLCMRETWATLSLALSG